MTAAPHPDSTVRRGAARSEGPGTDGRVYRVREVALMLAVKPSAVLGWVRSGELAAIDLTERRGTRPRWRIRGAQLEAFLDARTNRPAPPKRSKRVAAPESEVIRFF